VLQKSPSKTLLILTLTLICATANALEGIPKTVTAAEQTLTLNGAGERTKFFMTVYNTELYLKQKSQDAKDIIKANQPMVIRMKVVSSFATVEKVKNAFLEGFNNATNNNTSSIQTKIDLFLKQGFSSPIIVGDIFEFIYTPKFGIQTIKNNEQLTITKGLEFKQALFGIWLSENPAQESLKEELLGQY
jgi:hypothetical protein